MQLRLDLIEVPNADLYKEEDIDSLAESISEKGLFHPPAVRRTNSNFTAIMGRKRVLACKKLGLETIEATIMEEEKSDDEIKVLQIHENLKRTNLPWWEMAELVKTLHEIQQSILGVGKGDVGPKKTGWSLRDTAQELGRALGPVSEDIMLAKACREDPTLRNITDRNTAVMMVRNKVKQIEMQQDAGAVVTFETNKVYCGSSEEILKNFPRHAFNACITDPPWIEFRDDKYIKDEHTEKVFHEIYRVLDNKSFLFLFCGIDDFMRYRNFLPTLGFTVQQHPVLWCKPNTITRGIRKWEFARDFEMILLAIKGSPVLTELAMHSGFFVEPPVHSSKLIHPNEKPINLIKQLIETCSYSESLILDPFAGSGVTAEACYNTGRRFVVIERDPEIHAKIVRRLK